MTNNIATKIVILVVALATAIGGVLFFIKTIVSPPEDVKTINVHEPNLEQDASSFNPDTLSLEGAEKEYNRIVDKASIYYGDTLISDVLFDSAVSTTTEKFATTFTKWCFSEFSQYQWNTSDLQTMTRLIGRLRQVTINKGSKKALQADNSSKLTQIEGVIQQYHAAWGVARRTRFVNYESARQTVNEARRYSSAQYLQNCASLRNALGEVGSKLERSRFYQLRTRVNRLHNLYNFSSKEAYDNESTAIYDLIKEFKETSAFGVSTASDAETLGNMQDNYDRIANDYNWQN